jgi:hypothetical protein
MMVFRKAERRRAYLRSAICGPPGSGKSLTSLLIAYGICGDWSNVAVIDTERGSGDLYVGAKVPGAKMADVIGEYQIATLNPPFTPAAYIEGIKAAPDYGVEVLIIDSLSHAWEGEGGVLEMHDQATAASRSKNSYMAWREVTPQHNALVDAIIGAPMHVIVTMRTKMAYEVIDDGGKKKPVKLGMKPIQREGVEYEFTTVFDMSVESHVAKADKDRTGLFDAQPHVPNIETGTKLRAWLNAGIDTREIARADVAATTTVDGLRKVCSNYKDIARADGWLPDLEEMFRNRQAALSDDESAGSDGAAQPPKKQMSGASSPDPDPATLNHFYRCKCGNEVEGPCDEDTACPACGYIGAWMMIELDDDDTGVK